MKAGHRNGISDQQKMTTTESNDKIAENDDIALWDDSMKYKNISFNVD